MLYTETCSGRGSARASTSSKSLAVIVECRGWCEQTVIVVVDTIFVVVAICESTGRVLSLLRRLMNDTLTGYKVCSPYDVVMNSLHSCLFTFWVEYDPRIIIFDNFNFG